MNASKKHNYIVFAQHGMADDNQDILNLARQVSSPNDLVIAPDLGFLNTFFSIKPLIKKLEKTVRKTFQENPKLSAKIIANSLGGILWVELLTDHPEWLNRVESVIFLGSPLGGADLARIIDPFGLGIGIAKDLGKNRRHLAEKITSHIPTLVIAGNTTGGGDGTIPIESTKLQYTYFICLDGVAHAKLKKHSTVIKLIREFWSQPRSVAKQNTNNRLTKLIQYFRQVEGITDADKRDFHRSQTIFTYSDGIKLRAWKNIVGVQHIFIEDSSGNCVYSGFVGWIHSDGLNKAILRAKNL